MTAIPMPLHEHEIQMALEVARAMARAGIPIFVAKPALDRKGNWQPLGGTGNCGYILPNGWQATVADASMVDHWRPGWALCAVGGTTADFLDNDPRNGGDASAAELSSAGFWPRSYGRQATPSGGAHDLIAPLKVGSRDALKPGLDLKGGTPPDAKGDTHRGFIFLAPTVKKSKTDGAIRGYRWLRTPDLASLVIHGPADMSGGHIALLARATSSARMPGPPRPEDDPFFIPHHGEVRTFTLEQARAFCAPYLDALYNAQIGNIYNSLNTAALILGHFSEEFWPYTTTMNWLQTALSNTAYNGATWQADKTIDKALTDGLNTWRAVRVEPEMMPPPKEHTEEGTKKRKKTPRRLPIISDRIWDQRSWLRAIRDRARETTAVPDATLGAALAIYSSAVPHNVKIRTGIKGDLGASLLVGVVSGSGLGKSSGWDLARREFAPVDAPTPKANPTGEGIAEELMGWVSKDVLDPASGDVKKVKEHVQVGHNALFTIGEGEAMNVAMERSGSLLGPTLRLLFSDEALGTATASVERHRNIPAGSYSIGVVALYQEQTAMRIVNDTDTGMAQRVLWFSGHSPSAAPTGMGQVHRFVSPNITGLVQEEGPDGSPQYVLKVEPSITDRLRTEDAAKRDGYSLGDVNRDSQKPVLVAKIAALSCLIEGRTLVTEADWQLAEELYGASRAIQDELIEFAEEQDRAKRQEAATKAGEADHIRKAFRSEVYKIAVAITRKVLTLDRPATRRELRDSVSTRRRTYLAEALELATLEQGWLKEIDGKFEPGSVGLPPEWQ